MTAKINIRFLNWFLVIQFIVLMFFAILIEALILQSIGEFTTRPFFTQSNDLDPSMFLVACLNGVAMIIFFYDAKRYHSVRSRKKDSYLASLVFFSMIYQGFSRLIEIQNILYGSGYLVMTYVIRKYYFPLDIIGTILFAIVVFEVFMRPRFKEEKAAKISNLLFLLAIFGDLIGILPLFFPWFSPTSAFVISVLVMVITIYSIIVIIYVVIIWIIVGLYKRETDVKSKSALLTIMLMLIVFLAIHVFLVLSETGANIGLLAYIAAFRIIKVSLYCSLAVLYYFSFVRPSSAHS